MLRSDFISWLKYYDVQFLRISQIGDYLLCSYKLFNFIVLEDFVLFDDDRFAVWYPPESLTCKDYQQHAANNKLAKTIKAGIEGEKMPAHKLAKELRISYGTLKDMATKIGIVLKFPTDVLTQGQVDRLRVKFV